MSENMVSNVQDAEFSTVEAGTALTVNGHAEQTAAPTVQTITLRDKQTTEKSHNETVIGRAIWKQVPGFREISKEAGHRIEDAFAESGMDWQTEKANVYLGDGVQIPETYAIRRLDTGRVLGMCGSTWRPVPNAVKFSLLAPYLDNDLCRIVGVGEVDGGSKVTVVLQISQAIAEIRKGDEIGSFLTVTDHFNGRQGLKVNLFSERLICTNGMTQTATLSRAQIKHSRHGEKRLSHHLADFQNVRKQIIETTEKMELLAQRQIPNVDRAVEYVTRAMDFSAKLKDGKMVLPTRSENTVRDILSRSERTTFGLGKGTWYDLFQGMAEYRTHVQGRSPETRLDSLLHGPGAVASQRDFDLALEMSA